jgi:sulfate transport system ATP-binding protein
LEVSDRVVLMNSGVIEQVGTPNDVWENPASSFVYGFLGNVNLFHGRAHQGEMSVGGIRIPTPEHQGGEARRAQAYVRPHELQIDRYIEGASGIDSRVHRAIVVGPIARIELNTQIKNAEGIPRRSKSNCLRRSIGTLSYRKETVSWFIPSVHECLLSEGILRGSLVLIAA